MRTDLGGDMIDGRLDAYLLIDLRMMAMGKFLLANNSAFVLLRLWE